MARLGTARPGSVWRGMDWLLFFHANISARIGEEGSGIERHGMARPDWAGNGRARWGLARRGMFYFH